MIKRTKNFISFFVSAFIVLSISVSAFADPLTGGLIGVIDALGVIVGGSGLTPVIINDQVGDPTRTDVPIGLDRTYVRVNHNATVIDDVVFDSIIFSPEYAAFLREEGLGWIADNSIDPNSTGTIASGLGFVGGIPIFDFGADAGNYRYRSQGFFMPTALDSSITVGDFTFTNTYVNPNNGYINFTCTAPGVSWFRNNYDASVKFEAITSNGNLSNNRWSTYDAGRYWNGQSAGSNVLLQNFSFDYVSGVIDTSEHDGEALQVLVPSGHLEDVSDGDYPVTGGAPPSVDLEAINQAIIDAIVELEELITEFIENPPVPTPTPTPIPIPTDALGLVPTTTWMDIFGSAVKQGIENINDTIGLFKEEVSDFFDTVGQGIHDSIEDVYDLVGLFKDDVLDTLDSWGQSIKDGLDDLGDIFNTGVTTLRNILEAIRTAVATIVNTLTEVLEHIKQGHLDLFQPVFDGIKIVFAPVLLLLKSALSLWHYVVEWVQATAPVFSTFFGFMSGTNYNMVLPIYAALAGPICIAIYKRFGR